MTSRHRTRTTPQAAPPAGESDPAPGATSGAEPRAQAAPGDAGATGAQPHPRHRLNEALTHPVRFSLVAALAAAEEVDFPTLRDLLQVSDSVLSRQASHLEGLELVAIRKGYVGKRPRTWMSLTAAGRQQWRTHLEALRTIAGD